MNRQEEWMHASRTGICFVGQVVYKTPLNRTEKKRLKVLSELAEVNTIAFSNSLRPHILRNEATIYLLPGPRYAPLKCFIQAILGYGLLMSLIFRNRIEIMIAQSPVDGFVCALAKRTAELLGRKVALVIENHGDYMESIFLQRKIRLEKLYRWFIKRAARFSSKNADSFRAVSGETREQLRDLAEGKPIIQFIAWTDIDAFKEAYQQIASAERSQEVVCFSGALIPRKGVEYLLEAFSKIQDLFNGAFLEIIGPELNQQYCLELKKKTRVMGLEKRVTFVGELSQEEMAERLARSRVLVLPSLSEGLGRVIIEAMACGVPVVCSSVGGIKDVVENGKTGFLVPPGDAEALAEKLKVLLSDRELALRMGEEGRSRVGTLFSPRAYKEGYQRVIAAALENAKEGRP